MNTIWPKDEEQPLKLLRRCGGYYECPRGPDGKRLGPLVGYAGRYDGPEGKKLQWVGDIYANFAKAERHGPVLRHFAKLLLSWIRDDLAVTSGNSVRWSLPNFCGAPEGGKALATAVAVLSGNRYIFPEKKVTALATPTSREVSELVFGRHEPAAGEQYWVVEDVCNNFSTTAELIALVEKFGAEVVGVACFLNRSLTVDQEYEVSPGRRLPVVSIVRKPIDEWKQDDPEVAVDIAAGNVVWKPKTEWQRLEDATAAAGPA